MKVLFNIFWIYVIVLDIVCLCCVGSEVMIKIFFGMMDKEEVSWCMYGSYIFRMFSFLSGVGVDFYIGIYIVVCVYEIW